MENQEWINRMFPERKNLKPISSTRFRVIAGSGLAIATLLGLPAVRGQGDPSYREWRRRIAETSRQFLNQDAENPFETPTADGVSRPRQSPTPQPSRPTGEAPLVTGTGAGSHLPSATEAGLMLGDRLAEWDWRERLRWFQTWGGGPGAATETESASGAARIGPSTSSYWWFQNPFSAP
jgi:hypothetical protein